MKEERMPMQGNDKKECLTQHQTKLTPNDSLVSGVTATYKQIL